MFWTIYLITIIIYAMLTLRILSNMQDKETVEITFNSAWLITIIPVLNTAILLVALIKTLYSILK